MFVIIMAQAVNMTSSLFVYNHAISIYNCVISYFTLILLAASVGVSFEMCLGKYKLQSPFAVGTEKHGPTRSLT